MSKGTVTDANAELLIAAHAKENPDGDTLLAHLLKYERFDEALVLVESGRLVHDGKKSALLMAISHGSPSKLACAEKKNSVDARRLVDAFIAQKAPLYVDDRAQFMFLSWGPSDEDAAVALVDELLRHYGTEGTFAGGATLLHAAAGAGLTKLVEHLLRAGLDPTKATESGETPAKLAAEASSPDRAAACLRLLLDHGKAAKLEGSSLVHAILDTACHLGLKEMNAERAAQVIELCRIALDHGENLLTKDRFGKLPLDAFLTSLAKGAPTFDEASYPTYMSTSDAQIFARDVALFLIDRGAATPETLPLIARAHLAYLLEALLERDPPAPDATYGKAKSTLLHAVLGRDEFSGEMTARSIRCLLRYGLSPEQMDAKKKTAWDQYTKVKRTLRPAWRTIIEAAYQGALAEMMPGRSPKPKDAKAKNASRSKAEKAGIRFPCASMHLAVLGALWEQKLMKLPLKKLLADIEVDADEPDDALREAVTRLHDVPIDPEAAAKLTRLDFGGGNAIYLELEELLDAHTGGETEVYQLDSLEGIDKLKSLRSLSLSGFGYNPSGIDLKPLTEHPSLSEITLSGNCAHQEALASIANLSKVDFDGGASLGEDVLARLRAKSVAI